MKNILLIICFSLLIFTRSNANNTDLFVIDNSLMEVKFQSLNELEKFVKEHEGITLSEVKVICNLIPVNYNMNIDSLVLNLYDKGREDAKLNYRSPAATILGFAVVPVSLVLLNSGAAFAPLLLATPLIVAAIPIDTKKLDKDMVQKPDYVKGYKKQALYKKINNILTGEGSAAVISGLVIAVILYSSPSGL